MESVLKMKRIIYSFIVLFCLVAGSSRAEEASLFTSVARQSSGQSISGATVTVYLANSSTLAVIYANVGATVLKGNPFLTDSLGNYTFFAKPGLYKITVTKSLVGTFTTDYVPVGTQSHANTHSAGGVDPLNLSQLPGSITSAQITDGTVVSADISATAAIPESKLSLIFPTHSNTDDPTSNQKGALAGTTGAPSSLNKYVTNLDTRLSDARSPLAHAGSHTQGGSDPIMVTVAQITGINPGNDLTQLLEVQNHHSKHQDGGSDEISVTGLSGLLGDPQKVAVLKGGTSVGTRQAINFIQGSNATLTLADNPGQNRVDVTITGPSPSLGANVSVQQGLTTISNPINVLWFSTVGFTVVESPTNQANVSINTSTLPTGGDLTGFVSAPVVSSIQGKSVATATPTDQQVLQWNNSTSKWTPTDLDHNATKLQNRTLASTAPTNGQAMVWNNSLSRWEPGDVSTAIQILEGGSVVTAQAQKINFGNGFDLTESPTGQDNVALDLSEITVNADTLKTVPVSVTTPTPGQVMKYNGSAWAPGTDNSSGSSTIKQDGVTVMSADMINFKTPLIATNDGSTQAGATIATNSITNDLIKWGTTGTNVSTTNVPEGTNLYYTDTRVNTNLAGKTSDNIAEGGTNKYLSSSQKSALTGSGDTTLHFHASDRNLANSTGTLDATKVGAGLTDTQVNDDLTISSAGAVDGSAVKSGTISSNRLGNIKVQVKSWVVNYPDTSSGMISFSYIYFPVASTITQIAGRTRVGTCTVNVGVNGTDALSSGLSSTTSGNVTTSITNPTITAGAWVQVEVSSCSGSVTELTVNMVYTIN